MTVSFRNHPPRRGAALLIALVLLAFIGAIASITLPQLLRDRQDIRMELVRQQTQWLLDDALRRAEAKRRSDSEFSGDTVSLGSGSLGSGHQPFEGSFQVTTTYNNDRFHAEVEYSDSKGKTRHRAER